MSTAFEPLLARVDADRQGQPHPPDRISVRDLVLEVEIGAFQSERGTRQRVRFGIVVEVVPDDGVALTDDVDRVLSYDKLTEAVEAELAAERVNLLETLADRIAARILRHPKAARVYLRIEKLDRGPYELGVEIVRDHAPIAPDAPVLDAPVPLVVLFGPEMLTAPDLSAHLDDLGAGLAPVVICVDPGDAARPQAAHPAAQRRIDLFAVEQAAWVLAGRDPRCVVVSSRTELDWAARHDQMTVWAPSKMLLDSTDPDAPRDGPPAAMALWLARLLGAAGATRLTEAGQRPIGGAG